MRERKRRCLWGVEIILKNFREPQETQDRLKKI